MAAGEGADAESEPVIGIDVAEEIEFLEAILQGAAPFFVGWYWFWGKALMPPVLPSNLESEY